jgi:hypothetical protein
MSAAQRCLARTALAPARSVVETACADRGYALAGRAGRVMRLRWAAPLAIDDHGLALTGQDLP